MLFDLCLLLRSFIFHRIFARIQNKDPTSGSGNGGGQSQFQLFSVMPENMLFYGEIYTAGKNFTLPPVVTKKRIFRECFTEIRVLGISRLLSDIFIICLPPQRKLHYVGPQLFHQLENSQHLSLY